MKNGQIATWEEQRALIRQRVAYISGNSGRRAFDCVVIEINRFKEGATPRSIVLKTSGCGYPALDMARVQRLCRRLRKMGVKFNTALPYHQNNGVRGTMFANI